MKKYSKDYIATGITILCGIIHLFNENDTYNQRLDKIKMLVIH